MKKLFYTLMAGSLLFAACTKSNMETTVFEGLTIVHPAKTLPHYNQCNVPALGNYFSELMKKQGLQQLAIQTKSFGTAVFIWFPVQPQVIGNVTAEAEFAQAVANTKQKVYDNKNEVFFMLCDSDFKGQKLIGDCGVLVYENGKTLDISEIEFHRNYVVDCWENKLFYKEQSGNMEDEAGQRLFQTIPTSICFSGYKDYNQSIYAANSESLFEFVVAHISVEGQKHDTYLCLSYYFNAGTTDYLANVKKTGVDVKIVKKTDSERQTFKLMEIKRLFENQLMVIFQQQPSGERYEFQITAEELNTLKSGLLEEVDGQILATAAATAADYVIAYEDKEVEDENTGDVKKVRLLRYVSEQ